MIKYELHLFTPGCNNPMSDPQGGYGLIGCEHTHLINANGRVQIQMCPCCRTSGPVGLSLETQLVPGAHTPFPSQPNLQMAELNFEMGVWFGVHLWGSSYSPHCPIWAYNIQIPGWRLKEQCTNSMIEIEDEGNGYSTTLVAEEGWEETLLSVIKSDVVQHSRELHAWERWEGVRNIILSVCAALVIAFWSWYDFFPLTQFWDQLPWFEWKDEEQRFGENAGLDWIGLHCIGWIVYSRARLIKHLGFVLPSFCLLPVISHQRGSTVGGELSWVEGLTGGNELENSNGDHPEQPVAYSGNHFRSVHCTEL